MAGVRRGLTRPERQTDLLVVAVAGVFTLVNLSRLPIETQITVRYLVPLYPLGVYGLARLPAVRRVVHGDRLWLYGAYLTSLVVGSVGLLAAHWLLDPAIGEAMQLHALLGLTSTVPLAVWAFASVARPTVDTRLGAIAIAVPAALSTLFLLFTGFVYFRYGEYALPVAKLLVDWLPVAV